MTLTLAIEPKKGGSTVQVPRRIDLTLRPEVDLVSMLPVQLTVIDEEVEQLYRRVEQLKQLRLAKQALLVAATDACAIYKEMRCPD